LNQFAAPQSLSERELDYPFTKKWSPEPGQPFEVADGVYWLRMPLPIDLDHINLWLLKDSEGAWTIVDSGYDAETCKEVWEEVFSTFVEPSAVTRIVITHFHPDHIGLAAWLSHRCDAKICISEGEFKHYQSIINRDAQQFQKITLEFAKSVGFDKPTREAFASFFSSSDKPIESRVQASMCEFIKEGDVLNINDRQWRVVMGNGHSPEHACLYCAELSTMISGDQAIARISSNISVYPSNPDANPLKDWLDSCAKLRDVIPADTLILAAHQEPFIGIDARMQKMINDHHADLDLLKDALADELNTVGARNIIFNRELNLVQKVLATGETLAHLNYLLEQQLIELRTGDGVHFYQLKND